MQGLRNLYDYQHQLAFSLDGYKDKRLSQRHIVFGRTVSQVARRRRRR